MDVITPNHNDSVEDLKAKEEKFKSFFSEPTFDMSLGIEHPKYIPREQTTWMGQFVILFRRTLKEQWRKKGMLFTQLIQSVVIAVLIGTVFLQIGTSQTSTVRRQPVLFFCVVNQVRGVKMRRFMGNAVEIFLCPDKSI